jgi:nuclear RNA export factor
MLQALPQYLPKLSNLSLQGNNLKLWKELDVIAKGRKRLDHLRELVLLDNPVREGEIKIGRGEVYKT